MDSLKTWETRGLMIAGCVITTVMAAIIVWSKSSKK